MSIATPALLHLDQLTRAYVPGDELSGEYSLDTLASQQIAAVELSVMWYTEGKGDEDLAVHYFDRWQSPGGRDIELHGPRKFSTRLPNSPLSYAGLIVQIRWCVRMRVFLVDGKDLLIEEPFQLGNVPPPTLADAAQPASTIEPADGSTNSQTIPARPLTTARDSSPSDAVEL